MADIKRIGFGQIEPNHLSAQRTAQIYAQLPAEASITVLENGQFAKYDYLKKEVNFTGEGEWMLVYNEVKLYDDAWRETYKDFALQKKNYTEGVMTPRVFKTNAMLKAELTSMREELVNIYAELHSLKNK